MGLSFLTYWLTKVVRLAQQLQVLLLFMLKHNWISQVSLPLVIPWCHKYKPKTLWWGKLKPWLWFKSASTGCHIIMECLKSCILKKKTKHSYFLMPWLVGRVEKGLASASSLKVKCIHHSLKKLTTHLLSHLPNTSISSKILSMHFCEKSPMCFWTLRFAIISKWNTEKAAWMLPDDLVLEKCSASPVIM